MPGNIHLAQLHEHVDEPQKVARRERGLRVRRRHEVLVQIPLPLGQPAFDHVLELARELLLHVRLEASKQERPQDGVQPFDELLVHLQTGVV